MKVKKAGTAIEHCVRYVCAFRAVWQFDLVNGISIKHKDIQISDLQVLPSRSGILLHGLEHLCGDYDRLSYNQINPCYHNSETYRGIDNRPA